MSRIQRTSGVSPEVEALSEVNYEEIENHLFGQLSTLEMGRQNKGENKTLYQSKLGVISQAIFGTQNQLEGVFPSVAVADSFNRAAEKPLSNAGKWTVLAESFANTGEIGTGKSWQITEGTSSGAFWNVAEQENPAAGFEFQTVPTEVGTETSIWIAIQPGAKLSGYQLSYELSGTQAFLQLWRWKEGTRTSLARQRIGLMASTNTMGLTLRGNILKAWTPSAIPNLRLEAADFNFTKGFSGISSNDSAIRLNNFKTGEMPVGPGEGGVIIEDAKLGTTTTPFTTGNIEVLESLAHFEASGYGGVAASFATTPQRPAEIKEKAVPKTLTLTTSGASVALITVEEGVKLRGMNFGTPALRRDGVKVTIINVGAKEVELEHESASGSTEVHFLLAGHANIKLAQDHAIDLLYDAKAGSDEKGRWRQRSAPS